MRTTAMHVAGKPFLALTAADLMTSPVMTIPQETSLREAAHLLAGRHISGAPIVDRGGRCLGVLSSSDFVTWTEEGGQATEQAGKVTCFLAPWGELINIDDAPENEIRCYMKAPVIAVAPGTSIGELAQKMVDAHIHRVLVVVEQDRPRGIVTSTDILAAVAQAAQGASESSVALKGGE
jgi:CBS domain-containing protein